MAVTPDVLKVLQEYAQSDEAKQIMDSIEQIDPAEVLRQDPYVRKSIDMTLEELEHAPEEIKEDPLLYLKGYEALFDQYYVWIRATNPRWSVGGGRLMEWKEAVAKYEACYDKRFHLVERVTPKLAKYAFRVIPNDHLVFAGDKNHVILCAGRPVPKNQEENKESYTADELVNLAVGGLSARIIPQEAGNVVVIEWLMVDPEYRGRGIAHSLIAELFCQLIDTPFQGITAFCDIFSDAVPGLLQLFADWSFNFSFAPYPYHEMHLKQVRDYPAVFMLDGEDTDIKTIKELSRHQVLEVLQAAVKEEEGMYDAYLPMLPKDYWDETLSCGFVQKGQITDLLLIHKDAFGRLSIELAVGKNDNLILLLDHAAYNALKLYPGDTVVRYRVATDFSVSMQKNIFRGGEALTYLNAAFVQPFTDETPEEFAYFTEHPEEFDLAQMREKEAEWTAKEQELAADAPEMPELKVFD